MNNMKTKTLTLTIGMALLVIMTGCVQGSKVARTESQTLQVGAAHTVKADISMGIGILNVHSGNADLLKADFKYNVDSWKPQVSYNVSGDKGELVVQQPQDKDLFVSNASNEWDLAFNKNVPLDLSVSIGAGGATLNVGDINIETLRLDNGTGESTVDLTGSTPTHDIDVSINGGVGDTTLRLPRGVGVRVETEHGVGSVDGSNLHQNGNVYTNDDYGKGASSIRASIKTGVGEIHIEFAR